MSLRKFLRFFGISAISAVLSTQACTCPTLKIDTPKSANPQLESRNSNPPNPPLPSSSFILSYITFPASLGHSEAIGRRGLLHVVNAENGTEIPGFRPIANVTQMQHINPHRIAYLVSQGVRNRNTLHILDTRTGQDLAGFNPIENTYLVSSSSDHTQIRG